MACKKINKQVSEQRKINSGNAINKRILDKGAAINAKINAKNGSKKK